MFENAKVEVRNRFEFLYLTLNQLDTALYKKGGKNARGKGATGKGRGKKDEMP